MDNYNLKMITLSQHALKEKIDLVKDPQRIVTTCSAGKIDAPETYQHADVLFLSISQAKDKIGDILKNIGAYTHIILLMEGILSEELNESLEQFDIWNVEDGAVSHHVAALKRNMLAHLDLELKENQLYTLIDSLPDLIWYKDLKGQHIDVNSAFCKSVNRDRKEIKYRDQGFIMGLTPEEFANGEFACVTTDNYVIKEQNTSLFDEKVLIHDEMRQFKTYKTALRGRNGESIGTVGLAHDVTDIWNTHEEFRIVISRLPFPMIILDKNNTLLSFNAQFGEAFHCSEENQGSFDISSFGEKYFNFDLAELKDRNASIEKDMVDAGKEYHYIIEKSEITDVFGELSGYFYIFRDVTKTHQYEKKLRMMAETDELTQINNRKAIREFFENKLQLLAREKTTFAVAMIDIDFFKLYNDHYGHLEGDMAIKSLANILKSRSDNENILVGRFGGEEFLLLAIDKTPEEVKDLIEALMKDLKQAQIPHEKSKVDSILTMSVGVHYLNHLSSDVKLVDLIETADKHLYKAKEEGRNRFISNI